MRFHCPPVDVAGKGPALALVFVGLELFAVLSYLSSSFFFFCFVVVVALDPRVIPPITKLICTVVCCRSKKRTLYPSLSLPVVDSTIFSNRPIVFLLSHCVEKQREHRAHRRAAAKSRSPAAWIALALASTRSRAPTPAASYGSTDPPARSTSPPRPRPS